MSEERFKKDICLRPMGPSPLPCRDNKIYVLISITIPRITNFVSRTQNVIAGTAGIRKCTLYYTSEYEEVIPIVPYVPQKHTFT